MRAWLSDRFFSRQFVEREGDLLPHAPCPHPGEVVEDGLVRREIIRKQMPLAPGFGDVKNGVDDHAHVVAPHRTARVGPPGERFDERPLFVRQVRRIPLNLRQNPCKIKRF